MMETGPKIKKECQILENEGGSYSMRYASLRLLFFFT